LNKSLLKLPQREEIEQEWARRSYTKYVEYVHEGRWFLGKHLALTCNAVEDLINDRLINSQGEKVNCLIITMPPQHGKSQSVTETLPSYYLGKWPTRRVIEVSYGDDLARRFGRRNKQKIQQFGKALFDIELSTDSRSDTEFEIQQHKGSMISRGIMAGITGQPGDLIIIDDPIKNRQEADSQTYRDRMWEEFLNSIMTRLSANGKIIIIQTRWHEDDLAGRVISQSNLKLHILNLPCEAEEGDILGRRPGESLFPEIGKDTAWMQDFKKVYMTQEGSRAWLALFQGRPTSQEGNMIKRKHWRYWKPKGVDLPPVTIKLENGELYNIEAADLPDTFDNSLQSWDCSFKDSDGSDYVAGTVWKQNLANKYLLDLVHDRMNLPKTMDAITSTSDKWADVQLKLVEDKANGPAVIQMLQHRIGGIVAVNPEGSKIARVQAVLPHIESGNVYIPHPMLFTWVNGFINECSQFPNGQHDDRVDSMSQALIRMIYEGGPAGSFIPGQSTSAKSKPFDEDNADPWEQDTGMGFYNV
jgi:predicted phage terminase large subunit-like protein